MKHGLRIFPRPFHPYGFIAGITFACLLCWFPPAPAQADPNFRFALAPANPDSAGFGAHFFDAERAPLNAVRHSRYILRFENSDLPPARAFWSITMYDGRTQRLVDNPIGRHMIVSPMLPLLKRDPDGGLTLHIQHEHPGAEYESNWLPAPDGPFYLITRIYRPKPEAVYGTWKVPPPQPVTEGRAVDDQR